MMLWGNIRLVGTDLERVVATTNRANVGRTNVVPARNSLGVGTRVCLQGLVGAS